ncbi:MAG: insulinase family protein [Bacteroidetes bacterium]|nr:insulinase family protein [Bacteroidota bacterium]
MELHFCTLANGIRLVHYPVKGVVAHCGLIINAGSRDEDDSEHGIAHFIEHMLFKGTTRRKAWHVLSCLEDVGGELNAYTTKEETVIYASVLKEHYGRAVELIGDILINPSFPAREIEKEKEVVIEEINSYLDNPAELIFDEFDEIVFTNASLGRGILGTPDSVKSFTAGAIKRFTGNKYDTSGMVFCSAGDISATQAERLFRKYFGPMPANYCSRRVSMEPGYKAVSVSRNTGTNQAHCITGNIAYNLHDTRRTVMYLLNNILGGQGLNSRLNMSLREKNGYAYNVESTYNPYSDTGLFSIYFGTDERNIARSFGIARREMDRLMTRRLGPVQLSRSKNQVKGYLARAYENHEHLMLSMGKSLLVFGRIEPAEATYRKIEAITAEQIMETANEVFCQQEMSSLIYR